MDHSYKPNYVEVMVFEGIVVFIFGWKYDNFTYEDELAIGRLDRLI